MQLVAVACKGISPLLLNAKVVPSDTRQSIEAMAREVLYIGPSGELGFPRKNLKGALNAAGAFVKLGGEPISTKDATRLPEFLSVGDEFIQLTDLADPPWVVDARRGKKGEKVIGIVRPRFDQWGFRVNLRVDFGREGVDEALVRTLFSKAGHRVGLGCFRLQRGGTFGRFAIVSLTVVPVVE